MTDPKDAAQRAAEQIETYMFSMSIRGLYGNQDQHISRTAAIIRSEIAKDVKVCVWTFDREHYKYDTACGHGWQFMDGTPKQNGAKYCLYCSGEIMVKPLAGKVTK